MIKINLDHNWQFRQANQEQWHHAEVPGTVHQDLLANQIIENPLLGFNENKVQWVENKDWEYRTSFIADNDILAKDVVELCFEGLDTYADVYLNKQLLFSSDNMFAGIKASIKPLLKRGTNELRVCFHSPVVKGLEKRKAYGYALPMPNELGPDEVKSSSFTRKAPFHYGWDWGPRLVTSGIWRPVSLQAWNNAVIEDVHVVTNGLNANEALITVNSSIRVEKAGRYALRLLFNGEEAAMSETLSLSTGVFKQNLEFAVKDPQLWWPNGRGEACLHDLECRLEHEEAIIHTCSLRFGIRTIKLVQKPDAKGHTFYFEVNGIPVFMKGANVIPSETITPAISRETHKRLIANAKAANMNMLRVWGGAIYENDYFYQLCDENGLLVWQDFMFACALQPGDDAHLENIRQEAEFNVKRLRNHPCLALWCGNNEILHGWHAWEWQNKYDSKERDHVWSMQEKVFNDLLPSVVKQFDAGTSYWPSSPATIDNGPPDRKSGDEHDWTIWFGQQPIDAYWQNVPRFVSEWGMQAFPAMATIKAFAREETLGVNTAIMKHRQRSRMDWLEPGFNGNDMIKWYVEQYHQPPDDFEGLVYLSQLLQAEACKTAIEAHRTAMPHCMGSLFWQLNDCWPTVSWATVDYYFRWKAAHYAVKKAFESVTLTAKREGEKLEVYAVTDSAEINDAVLSVEVIDFQGKVFSSEKIKASLPVNSSLLLHSQDVSAHFENGLQNQRMLVLDLSREGEVIATNHYFFSKPKHLELAKPWITCQLQKIENHYQLTLVSDTLVKGLRIETPDPDAEYSDNFFDMLPGRSYKIHIQGSLRALTKAEISLHYLNP